MFKLHLKTKLLDAGGKPSTWFPPGETRRASPQLLLGNFIFFRKFHHFRERESLARKPFRVKIKPQDLSFFLKCSLTHKEHFKKIRGPEC